MSTCRMTCDGLSSRCSVRGGVDDRLAAAGGEDAQLERLKAGLDLSPVHFQRCAARDAAHRLAHGDGAVFADGGAGAGRWCCTSPTCRSRRSSGSPPRRKAPFAHPVNRVSRVSSSSRRSVAVGREGDRFFLCGTALWPWRRWNRPPPRGFCARAQPLDPAAWGRAASRRRCAWGAQQPCQNGRKSYPRGARGRDAGPRCRKAGPTRRGGNAWRFLHLFASH